MEGALVVREGREVIASHANTTSLQSADAYRLVYPYQRLDLNKQKTMTEIVESILEIKDEIENYSVYDSFDAVLFALRYIQENHIENCTDKKFVDCFGFCGAAAFYAAAFGFGTVLGIEFTKCGLKKAEQIQAGLYQELQSYCVLSFEFGSFQDLLPYDAHVLFLDCTIMSTDSMLDEGVLLNSLFFPMCRKLQSGTFLVILTSTVTLHTEDCQKYNVPFECVSNKEVTPNNANHGSDFGDKFPKTVWILKTWRPYK